MGGTRLLRYRPGGPESPSPVAMPPIGDVLAIYCDRSGDMWVAGDRDYLVRFHGDVPEKFGPAEGFTGGTPQTLVEDASGHLWVGTRRGALFKLEGGRFRAFGPADGLPDSSILALHADAGGRVWMGTGAGMVLESGDRFSRIGKSAGLPDDVISQILEDDSGWLWLGSRRGLFKIPCRDLIDFTEGRRGSLGPILFGRADGIPGFYATGQRQPCAWKSADGRLWFVGRKGVVVIDPLSADRRSGNLRVSIDEVTAGEQPLDPAHATFPFSGGKLQIRFTVPTFVAPDEVRFRYRLSDLDGSWTEGSNQRFAIFSELPPGRHRFEVAATSGEGAWSQPPAVVDFEVRPLWWQRTWVRVSGLAAGVLAVGLLVHRWSNRRLKSRMARMEQEHRVQQERARIARDLHDGIGAGLTQVGMLAAELRLDTGGSSETQEQTVQLGQQIQALARDLDAAVWVVSPRHDRLSSLCTYLCEFALEFFRHSPVRCRVDLADDIPDAPLSPDVRHHLFMTAKEVLNNILKHSGAKEARLVIAVSGSDLHISISDNGRGFDPEEAGRRSRNGLDNMRGRMREAGGSLDLKTSPAGTTVTLVLPLGP